MPGSQAPTKTDSGLHTIVNRTMLILMVSLLMAPLVNPALADVTSLKSTFNLEIETLRNYASDKVYEKGLEHLRVKLHEAAKNADRKVQVELAHTMIQRQIKILDIQRYQLILHGLEILSEKPEYVASAHEQMDIAHANFVLYENQIQALRTLISLNDTVIMAQARMVEDASHPPILKKTESQQLTQNPNPTSN